jgi:hypothetical protein
MGLTAMMVNAFFGHSAFSQRAFSVDGTAVFVFAIGMSVYATAGFAYVFGHMVASYFQMVYSLEQGKAKRWTEWLGWAALIFGYGVGPFSLGGMAVGAYSAHNERSVHIVLMVGFAIGGSCFGAAGALMGHAVTELRGLLKMIGTQSTTGKMLKTESIPILIALEGTFFTVSVFMLVCAFVPWLRHRAGTVLRLGFVVIPLCSTLCAVFELHQLKRRKAAQKQQHQITPTSNTSTRNKSMLSTTIADTIAATKQALHSKQRMRRAPTASLVLNSGVSLAFLELFEHENNIQSSETANEVVNAYVKPHTADIGVDGSGAFVELISSHGSNDATSERWCGTPTHMFSYSWSYPLAMIVAALRKYEREHPPAKGTCYYYFIDQFAFNQHVFSKGSTQQETEDMMLSTLKESISVPAQMICLLHPVSRLQCSN